MTEIVNIKMLDSHLQEVLNAYAITAERQPESARRTQAKFMAELDTVIGGQIPVRTVGRLDAFRDWLARHNLSYAGIFPSIGRRAVSYVVMALLVIGLFLSTGVSMTAYAASASLPGDALYALKTTTENVRARWTPDAAAQVHLYLDYAGRRLVEMQALIEEGRSANLQDAAGEYERDIEGMLRAIELVSQQQPRRALELKEETVSILESYSSTLTRMLPSIPGGDQSSIQSAIHISESAAASLSGVPGDTDDDDDKGNLGGRGGGDDCLTNSSRDRDEDNCRTPSGEVGGTSTQPTVSPATDPGNGSNNTSNNDSNNSSNNSGGSDDNDDDDDGDDDDGDDDDD